MRATIIYKTGDVRVETVPDARIVEPTDALLRITRACICGSDLWPYNLMQPARVPGRHNIFLAGDDNGAKETVRGLLGEFGWPEEAIIDLGGIRAARGTAMCMPLDFTLVGALGNFEFNIAVVRAS